MFSGTTFLTLLDEIPTGVLFMVHLYPKSIIHKINNNNNSNSNDQSNIDGKSNENEYFPFSCKNGNFFSLRVN